MKLPTKEMTEIIDPNTLDYSRGVQIIKDKNGKLHFRPDKNLTEEEKKEIESLRR